MVFFPCWCFIWSSFPAGASYGLLYLLAFHKFPSLKLCHNNQTKWSPLMDISQAMKPSLPQCGSPEHGVIKVSYCGLSMSVVHHAASTIALKAYSSYTLGPIDSKLGRKHRGDLKIKKNPTNILLIGSPRCIFRFFS